MDYNDNEFQSQNTQLVGEDNSKFPPGIRSYALPKFDLDEHLQVHLRFDSLVETEILLGIQNQEENNWIESYSGGSSGILVLDPISQSIESESCSISRPNNVWSEATSSESVEMLLNSVGQDEMIMKESSFMESGACDVPIDSLNNQMDPNLSRDNPVSSKIGDALVVDPMQQSTDYLKCSSGLIENAVEEHSHVEDLQEAHEVETTVYESLIDRGQSSVDEKCDMFDKFTCSHSSLGGNSDSFQDASTVHLLMSGNYNEELEMQVLVPELPKDNLVMEVPLDDKFLEKDAVDSHCSAAVESMQGDDSSATLLHNAVEITEGSSVVLHEEKAEGLLEDDTHQMGSDISGTNTLTDNHYMDCIGEKPFVGMEEIQTFEGHPDETHHDTAGNVSSSVAEMDSHCSAAVESMQGDDSSATLLHKAVEITEGSSVVLHEEKPEGLLEGDNCQMGSEISGTNTLTDNNYIDCIGEKPFVGMEESQTFKGYPDNTHHDTAGNGSSSAAEMDSHCSAAVESMQGDDSSATLLHNAIEITEGSCVVLHEEKSEDLLEDDNHQMGSDISGTNTLTDNHYMDCIGEKPFVGMEEIQTFEGHPDETHHDTAGNVSSSVAEMDSHCSAAVESMQGDDSSATLLHKAVEITEGSSVVLHEEKQEGLLEGDNCQMGSEISGTNTLTDNNYIDCIGEKPFVGMEESQKFKGHPDETYHDTAGNVSSSVAEMDSPLNITYETKGLHIKDGHIRLETDTEDFNVREMDPVTFQKNIRDKMENDVGDMDAILNNQVDIVPEQGLGLPDLHDNNVADLKNKSDLVSVMETTAVTLQKNMKEMDPVTLQKTMPDKMENDVGDTDVILTNQVEIVPEQGSGLPDLHDSNVAEVKNKSDIGSVMETTAVVQETLVNRDGFVVTEKLVSEAQNSQNTEPDGSFLTATSGSVVGEVSGDIIDSTSCNKSVVVHCVLPENSLVSDDAIEPKEVGTPHSSVALSDKKEELVNRDSMEQSSLALEENIHCVAGNGTHLVTVQDRDDGSATELLPDTVNCSFASPEKSELEGCTVHHDSVMGKEDCSEVPNVSSEKCEATSLHTTDAVEGDCGSPITIRCCEHSLSEVEHREGNKKSSDPNGPASVDLPHDSSHIDGKVDTFESSSHDHRSDDASENDKKFTFEVGSLTEKGTNLIENISSSLVTETNGKGWKPFPDIQPIELPQSGENSPIAPALYQTNHKVLEETPQGSHQLSNDQQVHSVSQGLSEDKGAVAAGKLAKEVSCTKQKVTTLHEDGNLCSALASSGETLLSGAMQVEEKRQCPAVPVQASSLPDLNTLASPASTLFQQPFTDLQQIQLRAQIFVYGSLIQGTVPDEACMLSAFGETRWDGGRNVWENVLRIATERLHNQKSPPNNPETPVHSRSGVRIPEQAPRSSPLQIKTPSTPAGRIGTKGVIPAVLNTSISLSSPVWSMPTPSREAVLAGGMGRGPLLDSHQTVAPLHLYQSPHIRHYLGPNNPWPSQQPCPVPWIVSPHTSAFGAGPQYSTLPTSETVQVTPVRDHPGVPAIPRPPSMQPVPSSPLPPTIGSLTSSVSTDVPLEGKKTPAIPGRKPTAEQKPRKRKKNFVSEEAGPSDSVLQPQTESVSAIYANKSAPLTVFTPSQASRLTSCAMSSAITAPTHYQIISGGNSEQRVTLSEETCSRIEQAKLHAEDAAALAASAVRHSQGIWSQLDAQKNARLLAEVEAKLASAAVAAAAAASVAKAAAAAAKVAYDAALQSKLMADEPLNFNKSGNSSRSSEVGFLEGRKNLGKVTPSSILKGKDKTNSSRSVFGVAREAARKRVEAASAAAKRAQNLDAVVKAAELAAEAVSQAGAIIVMGDPVPLTLSELVEAGPEGFWKAYQANNNQMGELSKKEIQRTTVDREFSSTIELSRQPMEGQKELVNGMHQDSVATEKGLEWQKGHNASDFARTIGVVPESDIGSIGASFNARNNGHEKDQQVGPSKENNINEGSIVEVASDEEGLRGVWFSAKVLSLKDGKAYVCFNEILSDEGRGQLKEWIPLEGEGDKAPRIRNAHPMTAMKFEGTRKRRRAAMGNHIWSVGDRVDAWMRDGWWEGIVTEKNKDDQTQLTVNILADGDSLTVKTWNLRPSLIWKNSQWIEYSSSGESNHGQYEGDTPVDKRQKLGNLEVDSQVDARGREKGFFLQNSKKLEGPGSLALSTKEKSFNVGKNFKEENNSTALRVKRTGLQKEGSKVVFGVPKPGKKKKFMDVSKHYVTDKADKINEGNDSIKLTQYLIPQSSRGLRNAPKVDFKRKRAADAKHKELKSGKSSSIESKSKSEKDSSSISLLPASDEATGGDPLSSVNVSVGREVNKLEKQNMLEVGCFSNTVNPAKGPVLFSSVDLMPDMHPLRKKSSAAVDSEQGAKGKLATVDGKLISGEEKASITIDIPVKMISDANEPRRSNRRIQPTSRLLEGLQSSAIIPKAAVSHDKASRTQNKISSLKGNNHG